MIVWFLPWEVGLTQLTLKHSVQLSALQEAIGKYQISEIESPKEEKKTEVIDETEEDLGEAEGYIEDADSREDASQNPQDIVDTYTNLPSDEKDDLEDYLEDREDNY